MTQPDPSSVAKRSRWLAESAPAVWDVQALLDGAREVRLLHEKEEYRLRLTRNNKLILTK